MKTLYLYGMRLRPFSIGTQPKKGFYERRDDNTGLYWDILAYTEPLTDSDCLQYDLDFIGTEEPTT